LTKPKGRAVDGGGAVPSSCWPFELSEAASGGYRPKTPCMGC
jgi:hypothetical protein